MKGTVTKKRNRWYIVYYTEKKANGRWKQKWEGSWETKKEAESVLRSRITDLEESFERKSGSSTLKVYLQNWLDTYCKERLAPNTIRGYRVNIEKHIVPYIGDIRLNQLRPADIQQLYSKLLVHGLSGTSVRYVHNNLRRALTVAVRQELIRRNPADLVEPPVIDHHEAVTLDAEQVRYLLEACKGTEVYLPVMLAVTLGLRRGESLALQWQDIDWKQHTVTIRHSATFSGGDTQLGSTKTKSSRRTLLLPTGVYHELEAARTQQDMARKQFGKLYNPLQLVCCRSDGSPLSSNVLWHGFTAVLENCDLPHIRFHDLRHTNATLMLRNAVPAKIVSSMLGHSSIGITMDIYSHVVTDMQEGAVGVMDNILNPSC